MIKKLTTKPELKTHQVTISDELWALLLTSAKQELRSPAGQAAYILRSFLTEEREHAND